MTRILHRLEDVWPGVAMLAPLALAALTILVLRRVRAGFPRRLALRRSAAEVGMVAGTLPWLIMGLWPVELPADVKTRYLVPLSDISAQLSGPPAEAFTQIVANLLVFFALGACGPVRFRPLAGAVRLLLLGAAGSLALEVAQQVFGTGRVFSVDDVLLNALGCLLGGLLTRRWWLRR